MSHVDRLRGDAELARQRCLPGFAKVFDGAADELERLQKEVLDLHKAGCDESERANAAVAKQKRLKEICRAIVGEECLHQDGEYETEMQRLQAMLDERTLQHKVQLENAQRLQNENKQLVAALASREE